MAAKIFAALITVFWGVMWTILVRTELKPHGAALRQVPPEHVLRILFTYEQPSELALRGNGERVGHLRLLPRKRPEDGVQQLEFSGIAQFQFPGSPTQRAGWSGAVEMDPALKVRHFRITAFMRDPSASSATSPEVEVHVDPEANRGWYTWRIGDQILDQQTYTLDQAGLRALMEHLGVDDTLLKTVSPRRNSKVDISAQQSTLKIRNEMADTFLVTVVQNDQTLLECHVSRFGQILKVTTLLGWGLEAD